MDIGRTEGIGGPGKIEGSQPAHKVTPPQPAPPPAADRVEISEHAQLVSDALSLPKVRTGRIEEIRRLIQAGLYENDVRLQGAIQKFLEENRDLLG